MSKVYRDNDDPANDPGGIGEDNYWWFKVPGAVSDGNWNPTNRTVGQDDYVTDVTIIDAGHYDQNGNKVAGDNKRLDVIESGHLGNQTGTVDRVKIDGDEYLVRKFNSYEADVVFEDPDTGEDVPVQVPNMIAMFISGNSGAPHNNSWFFRPTDGQQKNSMVGYDSDDDGEIDSYRSLDELKSITLTHYNGPKGSPNIKINKYNETFAGASTPCYTRGTMITTASGPVAVETLKAHDLIYTCDNGYQPIRWIGSRGLSAALVSATPELRPIRIKAGALGAGTPETDLIVSPQHRVLVRSKIAQRMFGTDEVLIAAKQLLEVEGIDVAGDMEEVEYFHILFDRHEVIIANGAESESLYTGPEALKSVGQAARDEIFTIFPDLRDAAPDALPPSARNLIPGRMGRKLATRHVKNHRALVMENMRIH